MKISNFKTETKDNLARVAATVVWEDRERPPQEIYFATTLEYANDLTCNPNAFLLAGALVAFHYGEQRIFIDAEICPELRDGLITSMHWMKAWYELDREILQIEAKTISKVSNTNKPDRAGMLFSGGIDALSTLRKNRLDFGLDHPAAIKDGLMVHGIADTTIEAFEQAMISLTPVAQEAGINLIPVYTNIYTHVQDLEYKDYKFWRMYFGGAALAAIAHAFASRLNLVYIAASIELRSVTEPWGTHPLIDPNYSSNDLRIKHDGVHLTRLDKTKLVAEWDTGLKNLRVCDDLNLPSGYLNCGRCSKCTLTMTTLAALNALHKTNVFPVQDISKEMLIKQAHPHNVVYEARYLGMIPFFASLERYDLIQGIQFISTRFRVKSNIKKIVKPFFPRRFAGS